ncbi:hypothetical protein HY224_00120 [Candidatus Uhrbacteria bacterium]|nr:hypothetical protein [Candidatus Uhrbacteria bacterium]
MRKVNFPIIITNKTSQKIGIEIDVHGFERLADSLGLYNEDFLKSLGNAEADIAGGRVKKIRSLSQLRRKK